MLGKRSRSTDLCYNHNGLYNIHIGNNIFLNKQWFSLPQYSGYAIGYGFDSILGPIEIKHSWSPETSRHFTWFAVGFWF